MVKYSFIIPVYNIEEQLLNRCINSILEQDHQNDDYEIIMVDDGSKQECADACDRFDNPKVKVIHKKNGGVTTARNRGIKEASGDWLIFVDNDDYVAPIYLSEAEKTLERYKDKDIDIVYFNSTQIRNDVEIKEKSLPKNDWDILTDEERHLYLLDAIAEGYKDRGLPFGRITVWGKLIKKSFVEENNLFFHEDLTIADDLVFSAECLNKAKTVIYRDCFVYIRHNRDDSDIRSYHPEIQNNDKIFLSYLKKIGDSLDPEEYKTAISKRLIMCVFGIINFDMGHKNNPKSSSEKLADLKKFVRSEPYRSGIKNCDLGWFKRRNDKIKILLLRFKLESMYLKMRK